MFSARHVDFSSSNLSSPQIQHKHRNDGSTTISYTDYTVNVTSLSTIRSADVNAIYRLCCTCSTLIPPNAANMCLPCIKDTIDITEGITKQLTIHHCSGCNMYLQPPKNWIRAEMESRELLAVILKRLRGLNKVSYI